MIAIPCKTAFAADDLARFLTDEGHTATCDYRTVTANIGPEWLEGRIRDAVAFGWVTEEAAASLLASEKVSI